MGALDMVRLAGSVLEGAVFGGLGGRQAPGKLTITHETTNRPITGWDQGFVDRIRGEQLRALYRMSAWVRSAVDIIANSQAQAKLAITNTDTQEVELDHPLIELMRRPNPFMTQFELMFHRAASEELAGNAYWMLFFDPREDLLQSFDTGNFLFPPTSIWPVMPQMIRPKVTSDDFITGYEINTGSDLFTVPPQQIVHFRRYDPESLTLGMPGLRSVFTTALADVEASKFQQQFNKQAMHPPTAFSTGEEMAPDDARNLKKQLMESFGGPDHAGEPMVLWSGLTPVKLSFTPVEAQTVEMREGMRDEILGNFRVSKSLLGLTDDVNRATAEAMAWAFAEWVTKPKLTLAEQKITAELLPFYGPQFEAHFIDVIPTDEERKRTTFELGVKAGAVTKDELRTGLLDLPAWGDERGDEIAGPRAPAPLQLNGGEPMPFGQRQLVELVRSGASADELEAFVEGQDSLTDALGDLLREQGAALAEHVRANG